MTHDGKKVVGVPKQNEEDECKKMRELLKRLDYRAQPSQLFYGLLL